MCRIFGFRSVIQSQVHRSLLAADNALGIQSNDHPDGWGVAFWVDGAPHLTRSPTTAVGDQLFHRLSGVVASHTVVAHVRKATQGPLTVLNCHPFQHGRWIFAHNGDIPEFKGHRAELVGRIAPSLRRFLLGDTDSEVFFLLILTHLMGYGELTGRRSLDEVVRAMQDATALVRELCDGTVEGKSALLTCVITNGELLAAQQGGKELYYSTYKNRCADRDTCPNLSTECEAPSANGYVNHFIISSEPLQGENVWLEMAPGDVIGVDEGMRVQRVTDTHHHSTVC